MTIVIKLAKMKRIIFTLLVFSLSYTVSFAQTGNGDKIKASYYHDKFTGRKTATGDTYRHNLLTAASNMYKLGTRLLVTNMKTGKSVVVTVNDRMAAHMKNRVDLSQSAFKQIGSLGAGLLNVVVEIVSGKALSEI